MARLAQKVHHSTVWGGHLHEGHIESQAERRALVRLAARLPCHCHRRRRCRAYPCKSTNEKHKRRGSKPSKNTTWGCVVCFICPWLLLVAHEQLAKRSTTPEANTGRVTSSPHAPLSGAIRFASLHEILQSTAETQNVWTNSLRAQRNGRFPCSNLLAHLTDKLLTSVTIFPLPNAFFSPPRTGRTASASRGARAEPWPLMGVAPAIQSPYSSCERDRNNVRGREITLGSQRNKTKLPPDIERVDADYAFLAELLIPI